MYRYLTVEKLEQLYAELRVCSICNGDNEHVYGELEVDGDNNLVAKATRGYSETLYEVAQ